jgi:uncharacterized membrane protein
VSEVVHELGQLHPALVHFPIALVSLAVVAEALYMARKRQWFGDAARFMIAAGAWMAAPAAAAGLAEASGEAYTGEAARAFSVHWVCGVAAAVLAFLAYGLGEATRRSGQVWEQALYRLFLLLAAVCVLFAAYFGGVLGHGHGGEGAEAVGRIREFSLTRARGIWY